MYVSVCFVTRCLYSAVSLTLVREQRFIRFFIITIIIIITVVVVAIIIDNNNVHLTCAQQRRERSHDTY